MEKILCVYLLFLIDNIIIKTVKLHKNIKISKEEIKPNTFRNSTIFSIFLAL